MQGGRVGQAPRGAPKAEASAQQGGDTAHGTSWIVRALCFTFRDDRKINHEWHSDGLWYRLRIGDMDQ